MSVKTQIDRLASAKSAIKSAIEGKGVTIPSSTKLDGMAPLILSIHPTCSVTSTLFGCTTTNTSASVIKGQSYCAALAADGSYKIESIKVTMGGTDVTDQVWVTTGNSSGLIAIPAVTGAIVIVAVAIVAYTCANIARTGIETNGSLYNGLGYKDNARIGSDGAPTTENNFTATGFIPVTSAAHIFRFAGTVASDYTEYGWTFATYDANFNKVTHRNGGVWNTGGDYNPTIIADDATSTVCISVPAGLLPATTKYVRFSCRTRSGISSTIAGAMGVGLIISMDEPIY